MVICDADDYQIDPLDAASQADATSQSAAVASSPTANSSATAAVAASVGAVTRTSTQLPSHAASVDDNEERHAASHADATSQSAAVASYQLQTPARRLLWPRVQTLQ